MSYQHSDEDDDTAPLLVPTISPPTMTTTGQRSKRMIAIVAVAAMMMLTVAGGTVWMRTGATTAEGLVVATHGRDQCDAPLMDATFGGVSKTTLFGYDDPFQTCYQYGNEKKYCWSYSYSTLGTIFIPSLSFQCKPKGGKVRGLLAMGQWDDSDPKYVVPYKTCGPPCQDMFCG